MTEPHPLPTTPEDPIPRVPSGLLRLSAVVAALRLITPIAAIPFVAALVPDDVPLLLLLRPGKEVLLLGGGLNRSAGAPSVALLFAAYVPLMTVGVWAFFVLGRAYGPGLRDGTGPGWLQRSIPPERMAQVSRVLTRRGPAIIVLGRLATISPTLIGAAAGASELDTRRYAAADLVGMVVSFAATVAVGYALGNAYERGGPWLTGAGIALVVVLVSLLSRWIQREAEAE